MKHLLTDVKIGENWILRPDRQIEGAPGYDNPGSLISIILKNVYIGSGILFFVLLLFGGISIILGAGQNDPKKAAAGQKAATAALTGFLIIFASYWIIQIISFITGIKILSPEL